MKVYYKNNPIKEVSSIEEGKKFIESYQNENLTYYKYFIDESHKPVGEISKIRSQNINELSKEYSAFIKENYKDLLNRLKTLGKDFYKENFIDIYFYNSKDCLVGFIVKTDEGTRKESIESLGLKASSYFTHNKFFEIK